MGKQEKFMSEKKRDGFVFGALILSFSGLITKIAGLIFRVVLTRMIGGGCNKWYHNG